MMQSNESQDIYTTLYSFKDMILRLERESQAAAEFRGRVAGDIKGMRDDLELLQRILIAGDNNLVSVIARLDERINVVSSKLPEGVVPPSAAVLEQQAKVIVAVITAIASVLAIALPLFITNSQNNVSSPPKDLKQITPPSLPNTGTTSNKNDPRND